MRIVPLTVVSRSNLVSWQTPSVLPGQTQWARRKTGSPAHVEPSGQVTLIAISVAGRSPVGGTVPLMNLWKMRTLPGSSESFRIEGSAGGGSVGGITPARAGAGRMRIHMNRNIASGASAPSVLFMIYLCLVGCVTSALTLIAGRLIT